MTVKSKYKGSVWVGAWAARYLFDETVNAILIQDFSSLQQFIQEFAELCQGYGGTGAARQLEKAANLLVLHTQNSLASECIGLAETIRDYPFAPSCLDLELVQNSYRPEELISQTLETICKLLDCSRQNLASTIKEKLDSDRPPIGWDLQIPSLFSRTYQEWFIPFASNYLHKYLPQRDDNAAAPCLQVMHWSQDVWRCWRVLNNQPTLIDSATFGPAQFFVWRLIHDSTHVWQMQAYGQNWSNLPSPESLLLLEAGAMYAEQVALALAQKNQLNLPTWYPSSEDAILLRLLIGKLERELRLHYDLSVHLQRQSVSDWVTKVVRWTGIPSCFLGFANEFLGMPGLAASYVVARDALVSLSNSERCIVLAERRLPSDRFKERSRADNLSRDPRTDVPNWMPSVPVKLSQVGTRQSPVTLWFEDPWQEGIDIRTVGAATVSVKLTDNRRGIHMSRLQEILAEVSNQRWSDVLSAAVYVAQEAATRQEAEFGQCSFHFQLIKPSISRRSRKPSGQPVEVMVTAIAENCSLSTTLQVCVGVMTACPCTLEYSRLLQAFTVSEFVLGKQAEALLQDLPPTFTHSQPGKVSLKLTNADVSIAQAVNWIIAVAHPVEQVLKREDEHDLVMRCHSRPMFCEDLVRQVAVLAAAQLPPNIFLSVLAELDESIHPHRVFAETEGLAEQFWQSVA